MKFNASHGETQPLTATLRRADENGSAWFDAHLPSGDTAGIIVDDYPRKLFENRFGAANRKLAKLSVQRLLIEPAKTANVDCLAATPVDELDQPLDPALQIRISLQRYESASLIADRVEVNTGIQTRIVPETGKTQLRFTDMLLVAAGS